MVRVQIVEKEGADLFETLKAAMREGDLRTFYLEKRGRKVTHGNAPGWINWDARMGVITCEILSPQKPGREWQILSNLIGRLADRYPDLVHSINIEFDGARKMVRRASA